MADEQGKRDAERAQAQEQPAAPEAETVKPPVVEKEKTGRDRRAAERVLVDIEVDYRSEDTFLFAYITDISALGIFVLTNNPEPAGTRLNLRFRIEPNQPPLEIEGEVIWINRFRPGEENINPGMGIQFSEMLPHQREQIVQLVQRFAYLEDEDGVPRGTS